VDILQNKIMKRRLKNEQQKERRKIPIAFGRRIRDLALIIHPQQSAHPCGAKSVIHSLSLSLSLSVPASGSQDPAESNRQSVEFERLHDVQQRISPARREYFHRLWRSRAAVQCSKSSSLG
jgi:hypothetical protein